jgi:SAM-dependent methyltransferase
MQRGSYPGCAITTSENAVHTTSKSLRDRQTREAPGVRGRVVQLQVIVATVSLQYTKHDQAKAPALAWKRSSSEDPCEACVPDLTLVIFRHMTILEAIDVPKKLQRNDPDVLASGVEYTGETLLAYLASRLQRPDLEGLDLLDVGCGVRFTQALINRSLPFGSYTGIEVSLPIVQWLKESVQSKDQRFHFFHWNVHNAMYNKGAPPMSTYDALPVNGSYDVIMGFSLFTHLAPEDASLMLRLMRKAVRPHGRLFFSAFCDESVGTFEDRVPESPLLNAYYNASYLERLIETGGWQIISYEEPPPYITNYIANSFLCKPASSPV